jgi:hypothetical protein
MDGEQKERIEEGKDHPKEKGNVGFRAKSWPYEI